MFRRSDVELLISSNNQSLVLEFKPFKRLCQGSLLDEKTSNLLSKDQIVNEITISILVCLKQIRVNCTWDPKPLILNT